MCAAAYIDSLSNKRFVTIAEVVVPCAGSINHYNVPLHAVLEAPLYSLHQNY